MLTWAKQEFSKLWKVRNELTLFDRRRDDWLAQRNLNVWETFEKYVLACVHINFQGVITPLVGLIQLLTVQLFFGELF